jgi:hypothetical protein
MDKAGVPETIFLISHPVVVSRAVREAMEFEIEMIDPHYDRLARKVDSLLELLGLRAEGED